MAALLQCPACRTYTLKAACPACQAVTVEPGPPKFSPEDRYGAYRRKLKRLAEAEGGRT